MKPFKSIKTRISTAATASRLAQATRSAAVAGSEEAPQPQPQGCIAAGPRVELVGFDGAQSKAAANPWIVPNILQRTGIACLTCPPHLTTAARSWIASALSAAAAIGEFRVEQPVTQAILLLNQPGPAELSLMTSHLAGHDSAPPVQLHLLCNGTRGVSPADGAFLDLVRNRLKPKGSPNKAPAVIHLTVKPGDFPEARQREAVVEHVRSLQRAGFTLVLYWEDPGEPAWSLPPAFADTTLAISKHHRLEAENAFKAFVTGSRFVDGAALPPMSVYVKSTSAGLAEWLWEQYISDDPQLLQMYRMKSSGATMKEIGAALDVDASTVCRNLKALEKELAAR